MLSINFNDIYIYIMVLVRLAGVIAFNPIFTQRGVPARIRAGLVMVVTIAIAPMIEPTGTMDYGTFFFAFTLMKELFIGFIFSYVISIFYYTLLGTGEILDTQFGLSMAKIFDPGTSIQMAISDKILNMFFILYIFTTNSHLLLFKIIYSSYDIIPVGVPKFNLDSVNTFAIDLFINTFSLVIRLVFPYLAAHFILQICLGVLMKLIPQIHIFVINMESKILLTLIILLIFSQPMANFIDNYIGIMFESLQDALYAITGG